MVKPGGIQIHLVIPKKFSTQTIMNLFWFPAVLVRNFIRGEASKGIIRRSYRDFPHYENSYSWKEYCKAFEEEGNEIIECEPGSLILPFILRPLCIGKTIVKLFNKQIISINEKVRRSKTPLIYFFSQTFTIVCKKVK